MKNFLRPHLKSTPDYTPILPFDVLSEQLGLPAADLVKLDANENPYGPLPEVMDALRDLAYPHIYPDPESRRLRDALGMYHGLPAENILVGAGADELIDLLMRVFLEPGECILNCPPTFGMYAFDAGINASRTFSVPRNPDFSLDVDAIEAGVAAEGPKLLFLANPNNPDGGLVPPETIERILALPVVVVLDEAYMEFAPAGQSWIREAPRRENLIVLRTFSKWAGLAGLRVGFGVFPGWLMRYLWKVKQPYNVSVAAQQAALVSLAYAETLETRGQQIIASRERLSCALRAVPFLQPYPTASNFILCRVLGQDAAQLKSELARQGILVRYFNTPGLTDHIRISVGTPEQQDRLLAALEKLSEF